MTDNLTAAYAEVLAAHRALYVIGGLVRCKCAINPDDRNLTMSKAQHERHLAAVLVASPATKADRDAAVEALCTDPAVVKAVKWNLDHYGPLDAEAFQYSRFESPAHAALAAVRAAAQPEQLRANLQEDWEEKRIRAQVQVAAAENELWKARADLLKVWGKKPS